jgi:hypothetical protein
MSLSSDAWFSILSALPNFPKYRVNDVTNATHLAEVVFLNKLHFKSFVPFKNVGVELRKKSKIFNDDNAAYFQGIHTLDMSYYGQRIITYIAFSYLQGIHTLDMICCDQETITGQAFSYLQGIHKLNIRLCKQKTITDQAISLLQGSKIIR